MQETKVMFTASVFIALIALCTSGSPSKLPRHCSSKCSKPTILSVEEPPHIEIKGIQMTASLYKFEHTISVIKYEVGRYMEKCPPAVTLYPSNERCTSSIKVIQPGQESLQQILTQSKCLVGPSCRPDSNECDADGTVHCDDEVKTAIWSGKRGFQYHRIHRKNMLSSSCVIDWECSIEELRAPIEARSGEILGAVPFIFDPEGKPIDLSFSEPIISKMSDDSYLIIPKIHKASLEKINIKCLSRDNRHICITLENNSVPKGMGFKLNSLCLGTLTNHVLIADCPKGGKILKSPIN